MRVLIGCEHSGTVRDAFIRKGHDAVSCDFLPTESPGPHIQDDVENVLKGDDHWNLIIMHPDCTKMCVSGNHVYAEGKPKYHERIEAVKWTESLWMQSIAKARYVCFENPVSVLSTMSDIMPKPQYIQPYDFGHNASKKTGLFLWNLPKLISTERVYGRMVDGVERWDNQTDSGQNRLGPSEDRWKLRSKTYEGVAEAMADQWGSLGE